MVDTFRIGAFVQTPDEWLNETWVTTIGVIVDMRQTPNGYKIRVKNERGVEQWYSTEILQKLSLLEVIAWTAKTR